MSRAQRGGGGEGLAKFLKYEEAPPQDPTPYPFIYHFGKKGTLLTPFIEKRYPFHIPTLEHCTPF